MTRRRSRPWLSLCMIVRDEQEDLGRCLSSVRSLADEIIVVDTGSIDSTRILAAEFGARVVEWGWRDDFAAARNRSLEEASGEWILILDADEELPPEGRDGLLALLKKRRSRKAIVEGDGLAVATAGTQDPAATVGYRLTVVDFLGSEAGPEFQMMPSLRLFRNRMGYRFTGRVHEELSPGPGVVGDATGIRIHHYGHLDPYLRRKKAPLRNAALLGGVMKEAPKAEDVKLRLGRELWLAGDLDAALKYLARAAKEIPRGSDLHARLLGLQALCLKQRGEPASALQAIREGTELFPDFSDLHYLAGELHLDRGDFSRALEAYRRAIALSEVPVRYHPFGGCGSYKALFGIGKTHEALLNYREALTSYTLAFRARKDFYEPLYRATSLVLPVEGETQARSFLESLLDLSSPRPLMVMADVFSILGRYETALEYASRAEAAGYPMDESALIKGICLMMTGRFDEALSELDRVPPRSDLVGKALSNRSVCCWLKRDYRGAARSISAMATSGESPEAVQVYRQLQSSLQGRRPPRTCRTTAHPACRRAVMVILQKFLALGRDEEMRSALSLLEVDDLATRKELAHLYYRHEKLELASAELVRAIDDTDPLPELLALLGEVEARRRSNRAAEILARAVEADPPGVVAYVMLARLYRSQADEIETAADASPAEGVSRG